MHKTARRPDFRAVAGRAWLSSFMSTTSRQPIVLAGGLAFRLAFDRPEERLVYMEHAEGHQIMLCQRHGRFETGALEPPLGQGAMFQIYLADIGPVLAALAERDWPIYLGPREVWRATGDHESGQREVFVQDPDGYLLMVAENIGRRPLQKPAVG